MEEERKILHPHSHPYLKFRNPFSILSSVHIEYYNIFIQTSQSEYNSITIDMYDIFLNSKVQISPSLYYIIVIFFLLYKLNLIPSLSIIYNVLNFEGRHEWTVIYHIWMREILRTWNEYMKVMLRKLKVTNKVHLPFWWLD